MQFSFSLRITVLSFACIALLSAQAPDRGPTGAWWAAKTKGGVYTPPNKPVSKLADLKAKHQGQANWSEVVVRDSEIEAEYFSAAAGTKFGRRLRPDTGTLMVVVAGNVTFDIEGQKPIAATRGSIVNILKNTVFSYEVGDKPALWVELNPLNYQTVYPADGPQPPAPAGGEVVKVYFGHRPTPYTEPNIPHWNLFEAAKLGPPSGYRSLQDHLFANPIWGYADPNDPENPAKGNAAGNRRRAAPTGPFDPHSTFGHMHTGPAEFWIVQSGQITGRFENVGEVTASEGDLLYAAPMMWHQMGFAGPGLSCRLALGAYDFINMQSEPPAQPAGARPQAALFPQDVKPFIEQNCQSCHNSGLPSGNVDLERMLATPDTLAKQRATWEMVAGVVNAKRMPPPGAPVPAAAIAKVFVDTLNSELESTKPLGPPPPPPLAPATIDWLTYNYDPERTGWNRAEKILTRATASQLGLSWKAQLDAVPDKINLYSTLTAPIVVDNVPTKSGPRKLVYVASAENNIYALDAVTGAQVWKRSFPNTATPPQAATGNCPNNLNATPVVDKKNGTIYILANDGKMRGLALADGEDKMVAVKAVPPFTRNFSLNLVDGIIYTSTTRGCGGAISEIVSVDVANPDHPVSHFYTSVGKASGPWGRGGIVHTPFGMLAQTADGAYDPAAGRFGNTVVGLNKDLRLTDSYTPSNEQYLNAKDFDLGSSSPVVFPWDKWTLVATSAKEGVIYLLDAMHLGGDDHRTPLYTSPRYSNDSATFGYNGMWSVLSTWVDAQGQRWVLAPMSGPAAKATAGDFPKNHGAVTNGTLMAFKVVMKDGKPVLSPQWMSADLDLPGVAVIANGVIYIMANGDRTGTSMRGARGGRGPGGRGGPPRTIPVSEVNPNEPGFERDAAWRASQLLPVEKGGQQPGIRLTGGRDTNNAVLYALDAATGDEIYSSASLIDSWNHDGGLALSDGRLYLSTYDARVFAFGLPGRK